jgi:hypothetical protein
LMYVQQIFWVYNKCLLYIQQICVVRSTNICCTYNKCLFVLYNESVTHV